MKKIMFATALAAFCGAVMADGIESQNVVGYTTKSAPAVTKFTLAAAQFVNTSGSAADLQDLFSTTYALQAYDLSTSELVSDTWYVGAAEIQVYIGGAPTAFYYGYNVYDDIKEEVTTGWAWPDGTLVHGITILPGAAVWLKGAALENAPYTSSGQVLAEGTVTSSASGYQAVANPLPISADINGTVFNWSGLTPYQAYDLSTSELVSDTWYVGAPEIQVYIGGAPTSFYYGYNVYDDIKEEVTTGWAWPDGTLVHNINVLVADGFWLKQTGGFTFTASR